VFVQGSFGEHEGSDDELLEYGRGSFTVNTSESARISRSKRRDTRMKGCLFFTFSPLCPLRSLSRPHLLHSPALLLLLYSAVKKARTTSPPADPTSGSDESQEEHVDQKSTAEPVCEKKSISPRVVLGERISCSRSRRAVDVRECARLSFNFCLSVFLFRLAPILRARPRPRAARPRVARPRVARPRRVSAACLCVSIFPL